MLTNKRFVWLAGVVSIAACSAAMGQEGADPADPVAPPKKAVRKNPAPVTPSEGGGTPFEPTPADPARTPAVGTTPLRPATPAGIGWAPEIGGVNPATNPLGGPGSGPTPGGFGPPVLDPNGGSGGPPLPGMAGMPGMPGVTPPRPAPKKVGEMKLEELLQHALQQNAEILSAQSKVREAEMEAIRTRQKVLANVVVKQADYEAAKAIHTEVDARYKQVQQLHKQKVLSDAELSTAKMAELSAKADLIRAEAALSGACAIAPPGMGGGRLGGYYAGTMGTVGPVLATVNEGNFNVTPGPAGLVNETAPHSPTISSAPKSAPSNAGLSALTKKLATKIKLTPEKKDLAAVLDRLGGQSDLAFLLDGQIENVTTATTVPRELPLGAALQWVEDAFGVRCIVREYGIVVTREDRVPPGALSASDLWRSSEQSILGGQSPRASDPLMEQKITP
jgi:hypothetical protein